MAGRDLLADEPSAGSGRDLLADEGAAPPPAPIQQSAAPAGGARRSSQERAQQAARSFSQIMERPITGATAGAMAPELAAFTGMGMQLIPSPPVRAAGRALTEFAPRIPRASSMLLGGLAGGAGSAAESGARSAGLSPEAASALGTTTELATGIGIPSVASRLPRMTTAATRAEEAARGAVSEAERRAAGLEQQATGRLTETIAQAGQRASAAEARLAQIDQALQQIAERDAIAAARAENRALDPNAVQELRRRVTRRLQDEVSAATQEARQAGQSAEAARAEALERVVAAENNKEALKTLTNRLSEQLLTRPQIDAAEFGARVRRVAQEAEAKFEQMREQQAKFGEAVASAGRYLRVDTRNIIKNIDDVLRDVRDPSIRNPLMEIRRNLMTPSSDGRMMPALNIAAADSLRKRLNSILTNRRITYENNQEGSAAAAVYHLRNIRNDLMDVSGRAHPAYKNAVETWKRISQLPEFQAMQRGGALRRTLTVDPITGNELINNAEVVGQLLKTSRGGGSTVVQDLIARDPELVNAARFYFNRELFGAGRVPSVDQLGSFLRANERPLRAMGLYDEFSNIRSAREAGQRALENVEKSIREARTAVRGIEAAETRAAPARRLITAAKGRQAEAVRGIETAEDIAKASTQRAKQAEARLGAERGRLQPQAEQARKFANELSTALIDIERAAPGETAAAVRTAIGKLRNRQLINDADYRRLVTEMQGVDDAFAASAKAQKDAEEARKASQAVLRRWRDRLVGAAGAGAGLASAGLFGFGPARFRRMFRE